MVIIEKIKRVYTRLVNVTKISWWWWSNPQTVNSYNFKMLSDLLMLIMKVAEDDKHMMTHLAFIHPQDGTEHQIVSIWAGAGVGADPTKRIAELLDENMKLKMQLSQCINRNENNANAKQY